MISMQLMAFFQNRQDALGNKEIISGMYDSIAWTHKIHEKQADYYLRVALGLQITSVICIAVGTSGILATLACDYPWLKIASAVFTIAAAAISIFREARNYDLLARDHADCAKEYLNLKRDALRAYHAASNKERNADSLISCVECKFTFLCRNEPRTTKHAVKLTEKAHSAGEFKTLKDAHNEV